MLICILVKWVKKTFDLLTQMKSPNIQKSKNQYSRLKMENECNKELLEKYEKGNKIAPLWHNYRAIFDTSPEWSAILKENC